MKIARVRRLSLTIFSLVGLLATSARSANAPATLVELKSLGGAVSAALGASRQGTVGYSRDTSGHDIPVFWGANPYDVRPPGRAPSALPLLGGRNGFAYAINNRGVIVGKSENAARDYRPVVWRTSDRAGVLESPPGLFVALELPTHGGPSGVARAINNGDDKSSIVGAAQLPDGKWRGAFWQVDLITGSTLLLPLPPLDGGENSYAYGINDDRIIVGASQDRFGQLHAVKWTLDDATRMFVCHDLYPSGAYSEARDINNGGHVVGFFVTDNGFIHAFRTAANADLNAATDDLKTLSKGDNSWAMDIDDFNRVAGWSEISLGQKETHAFLLEESGIVDINSLIRRKPKSPVTHAHSLASVGRLGSALAIAASTLESPDHTDAHLITLTLPAAREFAASFTEHIDSSTSPPSGIVTISSPAPMMEQGMQTLGVHRGALVNPWPYTVTTQSPTYVEILPPTPFPSTSQDTSFQIKALKKTGDLGVTIRICDDEGCKNKTIIIK